MCQHFGENYDRSLQSRTGRVISLLPWRYTRKHCVISHNVVLLTNVQVFLKVYQTALCHISQCGISH
jgi:hypothetical protein